MSGKYDDKDEYDEESSVGSNESDNEVDKKKGGDSDSDSEYDSDIDSSVDEDNREKMMKDIFGDSNEAEDEDIESEDIESEDVKNEEEKKKKNKKDIKKQNIQEDIENEEDIDTDEDEDDDENYLQKFDESIKKNIIADWHPEDKIHNDDEVETMCTIVKDSNGFIVDPLHKTIPFITKYEKARVLGERAKQLDAGAKPFVALNDNVIDSYLIAMKEYEEKKIPFIIRRPLPNGACEYWRLRDLEFLD